MSIELEDQIFEANPWINKTDTNTMYDGDFLSAMSEWHQAGESIRQNTTWVRQLRGEIERIIRRLDIIKAGYTAVAVGKTVEQRSAWVLVQINDDPEYVELEDTMFEYRAQLAEILADTEKQKGIEKRQKLWAERLNIASAQSQD